jgi:prepilin-type N-terminal cleavage/methylation domain-containing protein/prepilin-type processing-associated H-X9-DG protein
MRIIIANRFARTRGFTLLELLVVIAMISVLIAVLLPALVGARRDAQKTVCGTRLRELGTAVQMYAGDYDGRLMPLAYSSFDIIGTGPVVYWWGTNDAKGVDHERGFLWPYLQSRLGNGTVFECPGQSWGSYKPQGAAKSVTSTYGYNGYYLSPPHATSWSFSIGQMPWQLLSTIKEPSRVFVFADTMIDLGGARPVNNALLDPPFLYSDGSWAAHPNPTTSFRHDGRTMAAHADGHVEGYKFQRSWLTSERFMIGSVGGENGPHYVPTWKDWCERSN